MDEGHLLTEFERHLPADPELFTQFVEEYRRPADWPSRRVAAVLLPVQADPVLGTTICLTVALRNRRGDFCSSFEDLAPRSAGDSIVSGFRPAVVGQMLKGTRDGILKKVQPTSIHGQVSWDVFFTDIEDPDGQTHVARIGPEAVIGRNMEPGDRIQVEYLVGQAVRVTRVVPTS